MFGYQKQIFMDFIECIDVSYLFIGLFIAFGIGYYFIWRKDDLKLKLQYQLIWYGIVMIILLFSLPRAPWTATISEHMDLNNNENQERFLIYLQKTNDAIDRIAEVIYFMIFITTFWLVSLISSIIKHFKLEKSAE